MQVALSARVMQQTLRLIPATRAGAPLDVLRRLLPQEPADLWCRGFLEAALEHLLMWADYATPLKYHPEASVEFTLRPAWGTPATTCSLATSPKPGIHVSIASNGA